ncbi:site-specific integrase [Limosilactobacillus reuteri]|uniref:tyrosine-type recombinase/integrase n=1 Tax=Limosilactobacillus reuteri TaxID=1598 RepID=UPI001E57433F|nr:site-specific integrase [Limosilactobacillus reuteri]MCC4410598.1 site-specific integrase [Limosilactobacillus reuteri]MCC4413765.1 site-specific integrase [Limosilactobacillus reuteri]
MTATKYQSVYKENDKNGRKGRYYVSVYLGKDPLTGKRKIKKTFRDRQGNHFKTARDAYNEAERIKKEYHDGQFTTNSANATMLEFYKKVYKPTYKGEVEESTWISREPVFEMILTWFGNKKLNQIQPVDCLNFRNWLLSDKKGYSQGYASLVYGLFRQLLDSAVDLDYLSRNPSRIKNATGAISKGHHVIHYWTLEEFKKVISKCYLGDIEGALAYVMLNIYYFTGMRVSEALALWWSDINLKDKYIKVSHTLTNTKDPEKKRKDYTKTASGMRTIDIPKDLVDLLKWWQNIQLDNLPQKGKDHYVLSITDEPLHRSTVNNIVNRYADLANVHRIQAKELRTSHACLLINKYNVDILAVSQRLGHAKPTTTLKYYSQLWRGRNRTVADQLNGAVGNIEHPKHSLVNFAGNQYVEI